MNAEKDEATGNSGVLMQNLQLKWANPISLPSTIAERKNINLSLQIKTNLCNGKGTFAISKDDMLVKSNNCFALCNPLLRVHYLQNEWPGAQQVHRHLHQTAAVAHGRL
jgi:hypothetical protein